MSEAELSLHELLQACGALTRMLEHAIEDRKRLVRILAHERGEKIQDLAQYRAMPSFEFEGGQVFGTKKSIAALQAFIGEAAVRCADKEAELLRVLGKVPVAPAPTPPLSRCPQPIVIPQVPATGDEIMGSQEF